MIWGKNSYQDVEAFISVCFLSITQISFHYKLFALLKSLLLEHIMLTWLDLGCVWWILLLSLRNLWFCMYVQYCSVLEDKLKWYYLYNTVCLVWSLQFIPMPVLYGVFLYMGVASLNGVQVSSCSAASVMLLFSRKRP